LTLWLNEQGRVLETLKKIVCATRSFQDAKFASRLRLKPSYLMQQRKHAGALLGKMAADIAVLPFANLSEYRQNAYLADANTIFVIALCRTKEHNPCWNIIADTLDSLTKARL
jgi:hypothetical protein